MNLKLSKSKFRVVLTEVLPYERPLFYSNKFFARFLKYYDVTIKDNRLIAQRHAQDEGIDELLRLLSGKGTIRRNFTYTISKDGLKKGRKLSVMHPFHQVKTMRFYDKYSRLIMGFCSKSKFSIRYPSKIASLIKWSTRYDKVIDDDAEEVKTSESAKSYFHYEKISNISKFYTSYQLLNIEKNFEYLLKVDISTCFESIQPELLAQLVYANGVGDTEKESKNDFIYDFIRLHKEIRKDAIKGEKETIGENGIIIGPEVSRLFAEVFLQQIDRQVEAKLQETHDLENPKDYSFCRYVDDSFIAANSLEDLQSIMDTYSQVLLEYGLSLKEDKMVVYYERPFLDGLSLVKSRLSELIERTFENRLSTFIGFKKVQEGKYDVPAHLSFREFILQLRVLVAETSLKASSYKDNENEHSQNSKDDVFNKKSNSRYKDVTSFVFRVLEKRLLRLLCDFNDLYREYSEGCEKGYISDSGAKIKDKYESGFKSFCIELIESLFYILNSDLRMSTSLSVVRTLDIIQRFVRGKYIFRGSIKSQKFKSPIISEIDEKITQETVKVFRHKYIGEEYGLMEILNLLELQHLMYPRNRISESAVINFLERIKAQKQFNFFTVFQLIHFTQGKRKYSRVFDFVKPWMHEQYGRYIESGGTDTESLLTVVEVLCAPYESNITKDLSDLIGNEYDLPRLRKCIGRFRSLFISWENYSVADELSQRKGLNVY